MRLRHFGGVLAAFFLFSDLAIAQDCSFDPNRLDSAGDARQRLSRTAEMLVPTTEAATTGRRRVAGQPKGAPFVAKNFIDEEVFGKMVKDGVAWTGRSTDEEFLRRVTLDLTGQIPDAATVKSFAADSATDKRDRAIDRLLSSDELVDRWALWLGDHVQNVIIASNTQLLERGRNAYYVWMRDQIRANRPYDELVRDMLGASGGSFRVGPVNYWVRQIQNNGPTQDTYDNLSADSSEKFLGITTNCLSCHSGKAHLEQVNTSLVNRTREEFWRNAAFFAQVTLTINRDPASTGEYIIDNNTTGSYRLNTRSGNKTIREPSATQPSPVEPSFFLTGEKPNAGEARRTAYARILTKNPQFARATVNYLWREIFGMGIVEPADNFDLLRQDPATLTGNATLQPTHPELVTRLAQWFSANGYNMRELLRLIVSSNTYQLSSRYTPGAWNETLTPYYARHYPRRILAESVIDAVARATNVPVSIPVNGIATPLTRAVALPDPFEPNNRNQYAPILRNFGRGDRDTTPRSRDSSIAQALQMLNDPVITTRVRTRVAELLRVSRDPATIADEMYIATLSRRPTQSERAAAVTYLTSGDLTAKAEDFQYALINRLEFLFN